ncbi:MAG: helix-turn-helix domain-containing protein [Pseudomonadota bacterium]
MQCIILATLTRTEARFSTVMPLEMTAANDDSTRDQLLDAAEELFIEDGLNGASLRAIGRRAGQRNASAMQYHFENRDGLIVAILDRRMGQLEGIRREIIDSALTENPEPSFRQCLALLVRSAMSFCARDARFRDVFGLLGPHLLSSELYLAPLRQKSRPKSLTRVQSLIADQLSHLPPKILGLRLENMQGMTFLAISRRAAKQQSFSNAESRLFEANLVDQMAAMLVAEVSPETLAAS